jgi:hypothetical protein
VVRFRVRNEHRTTQEGLSMGRIERFEDIDAWKEARRLSADTYSVKNLIGGFRRYLRTRAVK